MASVCCFLFLASFLSIFTDLQNVNCSTDSAVKVTLGFIWTNPRLQNLEEHSQVVLTDDEQDLKLICSFSPPLPQGMFESRDYVVQFLKVAPEYHVLEGPRFWPDDQARTAVTIDGSYMQQMGTYACSYHGIWSYIDIVADETIASKLPSPHTLSDLEKLVQYRVDKTSVSGWSLSTQSVESVGIPFPCSVAQSKLKPSSVHKLLPSQVNVVAAMGDSLTAGIGAKAAGIKDYFTQNRGISWSIGGDETLLDAATLPNILRKFNKDVTGYSHGVGRNYSLNSELNVARAGSSSRDLPGQAQIIAEKLKSSAKIDYNEDWKLVTIFSGVEDLCRVCNDEATYSPSNYGQSIIKALKELQKIPRVLVNLVLPFDVSVLSKLRTQGHDCKVMNVDACPCSDELNANLTFVSEMHKKYTALIKEVLDSGMFDTKEDFAVVIQPFFQNIDIDESLDRSLFSLDCFHLSTKGHSLAAVMLWNNMVEDVDEKTTQWNRAEKLKCPSKRQPYIITRVNTGKHTAESGFSTSGKEGGGVHVGVVVFLSLFLGAVFILIVGLIIRGRKSRPRNDSLLSLVNNPHRAKI